jgi:hypothetical protein
MNIFLILGLVIIGLLVIAVGIFITKVFIEAMKMEFKELSKNDDKSRYIRGKKCIENL